MTGHVAALVLAWALLGRVLAKRRRAERRRVRRHGR